MLEFIPSERFDLNKIGLLITFLLALILLLYPFKIIHLIMIEILLAAYAYYLYKGIKQHKTTSIIINKQDKWFIKKQGEMYPINLKDHWILKKHIFFWAKGAKISVSFVVTRSIIGAHKFSQLRSIIK